MKIIHARWGRTESPLHSRERLCYWFLFIALCLASNAYAQGNTGTGDTAKAAPKPKLVRPGFDLPDSLYIAHDTTRDDIDTIVRYTAKDSTVFNVARKSMTLVNTATVQFQNREMDAYTIVMDFQQNTLTAYSYDVDSVVNASLALRRRIIRDTNRVKARGAPVLHEGETTYVGEVIIYNFKTRRGTVQLGTTEMEGGFYYGEKIKQVAPKTLFVENGRYTTCDEPVPHYYFESPKMKVIMGDLIFAEPVYLYVADVPVFVLPFGVFPNHSGGRHSGIIAPNYQTTGDRGYGLTHLGYYVVFNDYLDAAAQADIYTKGGWNGDFKLEWMKRYLLNSAADIHLGYGFTRFNSVDQYQKNWLIEGSLPNLALGYETQLNANISFQSNNYNQNNAQSWQQYLTQQITSNASFSTAWEDLGMSLGIGYSRFQKLTDGEYSEQSPSLNFNKSTFFPFASTEGESVDPTLASLGIGYNLTASRNVAKQVSVNANGDTSFYNTEQYGVLHSPTISISPKLGHFAITPSFSFQDAWVFKQHTRNYYATFVRDTVNHTIDTVVNYTETSTSGFHNLYNYNVGVGVSTTLYGIANINAFGIEAIRHTVIPSISLTYHPDLSQNEAYTHATVSGTGQTVYYNQYEEELNGGIVGPGKSSLLGVSLGNDFEAKVERQITKDSTGVDHVKLFHLDASSGYNLNTKIISPLSLSAFSSIGTLFNVSGNATFSFYPSTYTGADSTTNSLVSLREGLLRPQNVSASLSGSFSSSKTLEGDNYDSLRRQFNITTPEDERALMLGGYYPGPFVDVPFRPKWNVSYGLNYTQSYTITGLERNFNATATLSLPLTKNWLFTTSASYDLVNRKIIVPELRVYRDLHCWEMNFSYRPPGSGISGFNLEIRVKAPQLQDVKLMRTENDYGNF